MKNHSRHEMITINADLFRKHPSTIYARIIHVDDVFVSLFEIDKSALIDRKNDYDRRAFSLNDTRCYYYHILNSSIARLHNYRYF